MDNQNELNTSTLTNTDIWKVYPILILQSNLKMLRSICGLSKKDFGIQVGTTGQTITNLENGCNSMSLMCYGSIMYFLDCVASCGTWRRRDFRSVTHHPTLKQLRHSCPA